MNIFKIVCIIISTAVGAGFATGQEIMYFFNRFGIRGIWGISIMSLLLFAFLSLIMRFVKKGKFDQNSFITKSINIVNTIMMFLFFVVMVAGAGAFFEEHLNFKFLIGTIIFCLICYIIFTKNITGVLAVSDLLTPLIIVGVLGLGVFIFLNYGSNNNQILNFEDRGWLISSLLYVGYNLLPLTGILIAVKDIITSKKVIFWSSLISSILLGVMAIVIYFIIVSNYSFVINSEIPLLKVISLLNIPWGWIYKLILFFAILTSAISVGYSFLSQTCSNKTSFKLTSLIMCIISVPLATLGFSDLIQIVYPFLGVIGLIEIIFVCYF